MKPIKLLILTYQCRKSDLSLSALPLFPLLSSLTKCGNYQVEKMVEGTYRIPSRTTGIYYDKLAIYYCTVAFGIRSFYHGEVLKERKLYGR